MDTRRSFLPSPPESPVFPSAIWKKNLSPIRISFEDDYPPSPSYSFSSPVEDERAICHLLEDSFELIGEGEESRVYKAQIMSFGQSSYAAVKMCKRLCNSLDLLGEARLISSLPDKPGREHVVNLLGYDDHQHALILEYYPFSLKSYINDNGPDRPHAVQWTRNLIEGLEFLRSSGIVHGDIKPANILLNSSLSPIITDLSLQPEEMLTTVYAAPELLRLHASSPTHSSDLYSLGLTIYFIATGCEPYAQAKNRFQKLSWARSGEPAKFLDIPAGKCRNIVLSLTANDPSSRRAEF